MSNLQCIHPMTPSHRMIILSRYRMTPDNPMKKINIQVKSLTLNKNNLSDQNVFQGWLCIPYLQ